MGRKIRYVPPDGSLFEVTCRCFQARYLLTPSDTLNDLVLGVLARAQRLTEIAVIAGSVLGNHLHLLVDTEDAKQLADFMQFVCGNIAREVGRLHGWSGKFWDGRYKAVPVSDEEAAQVARLRYVLAQGCKEDLVLRPQDWPGINSVRAILSGRDLKGTWIDRSRLYEARRRKKARVRAQDFHETETLRLSPLPCWKHLSPEEYRSRVRDLVKEIEREAKSRHAAAGSSPKGRRAVKAMNPHHRPKNPKRTPANLIHHVKRKAKDVYLAAYRIFVTAFRAAAARLKKGDPSPGFPEGSFPPGLPFVRIETG